MGRLEESLRFISRSAELDPVSQAILKDKGLTLYYNRQYDEAIEMARRTLELDPNYAAAHRLLSLAYQGKGERSLVIKSKRRLLLRNSTRFQDGQMRQRNSSTSWSRIN